MDFSKKIIFCETLKTKTKINNKQIFVANDETNISKHSLQIYKSYDSLTLQLPELNVLFLMCDRVATKYF